MDTDSFSFNPPKKLIALSPSPEGGKSRLMVLFRNNRKIEHKIFEEVSDFLERGDLIVLNDTKVIPARLTGKDKNGNTLDILITKRLEHNKFKILSRGRFNGRIKISEDLEADVINGKEAFFYFDRDFYSILWEIGEMPLPPYIKRKPNNRDRKWYQTCFAKKEGSIAAPTAGLHFTENIFNLLKQKGVIIKTITLHVGIGTFNPIRSKKIENHLMEDEYFEIDTEVIDFIRNVKDIGKKVIFVGTTTTRAIEAYLSGKYKLLNRLNGKIRATTDLFIYPGYTFKAADAILTNFHLSCSTPLILASAFAGWESLLNAYEEAVRNEYRFYSYGDAMLIL